MGTVVSLSSGGYRLYTKGASEIILDLSTHEDIDGVAVPLTQERKVDFRIRFSYVKVSVYFNRYRSDSQC